MDRISVRRFSYYSGGIFGPWQGGSSVKSLEVINGAKNIYGKMSSGEFIYKIYQTINPLKKNDVIGFLKNTENSKRIIKHTDFIINIKEKRADNKITIKNGNETLQVTGFEIDTVSNNKIKSLFDKGVDNVIQSSKISLDEDLELIFKNAKVLFYSQTGAKISKKEYPKTSW